ncbi:helix-turn-helix domain-containing protein [Avibacterium paragallinarum]|uniref:Bacteriophage CI-repressor protein n=1 Tax=Avibacterium paragallinarum TaxID=728 RepID=H6U8L6_AVIPA|nr:helix-turn-helix domain-containing protein [Avibacterium paragallinarum]AFA45202.1 bacteriophage CI-repressor protein [Avibacterium paragallinarum]KAA6209295.1 bacteriophage CI repressor [Avibacterium paragallinarum]KKB01571.1 chromosome partitioning protein ParA [Avibacterium paragallinarum]RZN58616.1 transcriptional regulator [Avibacterium paragallinarum]RZN72220.1 transcriptional regulator [Avibacterium paragallinarum]
MREGRELNSYEIIERMKKICVVHSDKELAEIIGIAAPNINKWRSKNSVPFDPILKIANTYDVSIDWLIYGKNVDAELSTHEKMALLAFNDLDEREKLESIAFMTGMKNKVISISQTVHGSANNVVGNGNIHITRGE